MEGKNVEKKMRWSGLMNIDREQYQYLSDLNDRNKIDVWEKKY